MSISFKNFKKEFYSKFNNFKIFEGKEFNYFKIALEGLKVNYYNKGKFSTSIFYSKYKYYFFYYIYRIKKVLSGELSRYKSHIEISKKNKSPEYFLLDSGRSIKNLKGEEVPIFFSRLFKSLKSKHLVFYASENTINGYKPFDDVYSDLNSLGNSISHKYSKEIRIDINKVFQRINNESSFNPTPTKPPEALGTDMDPQVRRQKSKKDKNPYAKGTSSLRISLDPQVSTGQDTPSGGINQ